MTQKNLKLTVLTETVDRLGIGACPDDVHYKKGENIFPKIKENLNLAITELKEYQNPSNGNQFFSFKFRSFKESLEETAREFAKKGITEELILKWINGEDFSTEQRIIMFVRNNIKGRMDENKKAKNLRDKIDKAFKNAVVQEASFKNVHELDLNPKNGKFVNPEIAATKKGEIIIDYASIFSREDYKAILKLLGLEEKKSGGVYHFEKKTQGQSINITSFEFYAKLKTILFISEIPENQENGIKEFSLSKNKDIIDLFEKHKLIPISKRSIFRGGSSALKVFDIMKGDFYEIVIPLISSKYNPATLNEYTKGLITELP